MGFSLTDSYNSYVKKSCYGNKVTNSVVGEGMIVVRTMQSKRLGKGNIHKVNIIFQSIIKFSQRPFALEIKDISFSCRDIIYSAGLLQPVNAKLISIPCIVAIIVAEHHCWMDLFYSAWQVCLWYVCVYVYVHPNTVIPVYECSDVC